MAYYDTTIGIDNWQVSVFDYFVNVFSKKNRNKLWTILSVVINYRNKFSNLSLKFQL